MKEKRKTNAKRSQLARFHVNSLGSGEELEPTAIHRRPPTDGHHHP